MHTLYTQEPDIKSLPPPPLIYSTHTAIPRCYWWFNALGFVTHTITPSQAGILLDTPEVKMPAGKCSAFRWRPRYSCRALSGSLKCVRYELQWPCQTALLYLAACFSEKGLALWPIGGWRGGGGVLGIQPKLPTLPLISSHSSLFPQSKKRSFSRGRWTCFLYLFSEPFFFFFKSHIIFSELGTAHAGKCVFAQVRAAPVSIGTGSKG